MRSVEEIKDKLEKLKDEELTIEESNYKFILNWILSVPEKERLLKVQHLLNKYKIEIRDLEYTIKILEWLLEESDEI